MARSKAVSVLSVCSLLVACGGTTPPPETPAPAEPAPTETPKPAEEPKAEEPKKEEGKKEETPPPAAPELVKSTATIAGVSVSEIDAKALVAALQKAGWAPEEVEINQGTVGKYSQLSVLWPKPFGRLMRMRPILAPATHWPSFSRTDPT